MDIWALYTLMKKSRLFEEAVAQLWEKGLISGEMHLGTGEEAIIAGVVSQLEPDDAMAVDHRGSAPFFMRGVDPLAMLREMLGQEDGLCGGMGGHMHLYSKEHLAASSGIVGSEGPAAVGFALAAQHLRPGSIAVAFFGEGAMNQGMLMESINMASVWNLPVLFVCKDDDWSITTQSRTLTGGRMGVRARGLGAQYVEVDGLDVGKVWATAQKAVEDLRSGSKPVFLHAHCVHLEGHFLGFQLLRMIRNPLREMPRITVPLIRSFLTPGGGSLFERFAGMKQVMITNQNTAHDPREDKANDPVIRARNVLKSDPQRLESLEKAIEAEISVFVETALGEVTS